MAPTISLSTADAASQITRNNYSWSQALGSPALVTFGFKSIATSSSPPGFSQFSAQEIAGARAALQSWSAVANITFADAKSNGYTNSATILFSNWNENTFGQGQAYYPSNKNTSDNSSDGDVFINTFYTPSTSSFSVGTSNYKTLLHEIGHAIGLQHPGDYETAGATYENSAGYIEDTQKYSVMSYWDQFISGAVYFYQGQSFFASTPLLHDIAAAQRLYGANMTTELGNTTYGFNSNATNNAFRLTDGAQQVVFSVWDAGGGDTFDFSGYSMNQVISLIDGTFSSVGALTQNVSIAVGAIIENATGGTGNDLVIGNTANNIVIANAGNDTVVGAFGHDSIVLGEGNDVGLGNQDNDVILGNQGDDTLVGGQGTDVVVGGQGSDLLLGNEANDIVYGNESTDTIFGGAGQDFIIGGQGNDLIYGNEDNDNLIGNEGADRFIFSANSGADIVADFNSSQGDVLDLQGQSYAIGSSGGSVLLNLSGGGSILLSGVSSFQTGFVA